MDDRPVPLAPLDRAEVSPAHEVVDALDLLGDDAAGPPPSLGVVCEEGRGSLPFALLHGEPLVACAAWALGEAGVTLLDTGTPWSSVVLAEEPVVLHDVLCPATPAWFVAACVVRAMLLDQVVVGVRPVTDTVKRVEDGRVGATLDRDGLWQVASPLVLPARVVAALGDGGPTALDPDLDLARLVTALAATEEVVPREAPPAARRVASTDDVEVLAALTTPGRARFP